MHIFCISCASKLRQSGKLLGLAYGTHRILYTHTHLKRLQSMYVPFQKKPYLDKNSRGLMQIIFTSFLVAQALMGQPLTPPRTARISGLKS